ncbi:MAG: ATP-dependent DNA helicase RecG, partial [Chloroflexi bacterium]|nr:ATP-dependent DNA helicase RecG [Chloroflexota bacterium]
MPKKNHSPYEQLLKILILESERDYQDQAMIGGLGPFAEHWAADLPDSLDDPDVIAEAQNRATRLTGYADLSPAERQSLIDEARQWLHEQIAAESAAPSRPTASRPGAPSRTRPDAHSPVTVIKGVSDTMSKRLERLDVRTVGDLLYLFPRRYDDFSHLKTINQLVPGEEVTIVGTVWEVNTRRTRSGIPITTVTLSDETGMLQATWFNQPYLARQIQRARQIVISGKVDLYLGRFTFQSPVWEPLEKDLIHTARIVPVYPLTEGIGARWMRRTVKNALDRWAGAVTDYLPAYLRHRQDLMDLPVALGQMHFPDDQASLALARRRLAFDEFLLIQLGVLRRRRESQEAPAPELLIREEVIQGFLRSLPFALTGAQDRALADILIDLAQSRPMRRLLQGDVGSGKTVVALTAALVAVSNGLQAAIMAPTEVLAEQHYQTVRQLLGDAPVRVALLTGRLKKSERDHVRQTITDGQIDIAVGTHALIQEGVAFPRLALAVVDEQHRFGVMQRVALKEQTGANPHMLVMSATPIPRTLALTLYGDLDLSVIDELPAGRQPVDTRYLTPRQRERAYGFIRGQVEQGHQAFVICPLVEESEKTEAKAAVEEYERLQKDVFPDLRLGLLHGRLKSAEKEAVMGAFRDGELDILVSTSVVEVGIDVPNATVMLVEGANRFGLAQLHQFRGRVGRSAAQSYCLLLADDPSEEAEERLHIVERTHNGFVLAEEDLRLRGPGEFFGTRQSGLPDLRVARISDTALLELAREEAQ